MAVTTEPTIGDAVAALGIEERDGEDVILARFPSNGTAHMPLQHYADQPLLADTYIATGRFKAGTVHRTGRSAENVASIFALPIDSDLKDKIGANPRELPSAEVDALLAEHLAEIVRVCKATDLTPNVILNTGYGYSLWYMIAPEDQERLGELRGTHKRLVKSLNHVADWTMADPAVSDAGTRIMRLPGSANTKGAEPRECFKVHEDGGSWTVNELAATVDPLITDAVMKNAPLHEKRPPVIDLPPLDLPASVAGEIVALVAPYWTPGCRHRPALGLAGWLKRNGVSEMQTAAIIEECASRAGGDTRDLLAAVRTTYARSDMAVAGWTIVRDLLPSGTVARIDDLLSDFWRARNRLASTPQTNVVMSGSGAPAIAEVADDEDENRAAIEFDPVPEIVFQSALAEYCELVRPCTEAPVQYHVGAFLAVVGALAGRVAYTRYASKRVYANQYVMLVGGTGTSKKDTAINLAKRFARLPYITGDTPTLVLPAAERFSLLDDAGSDVALLNHLKEHPNTLLVVPELHAQIAKMRRKGTEALFDLMLTLWDANERYQNVTMKSPITVLHPTLSVLAAIQPTRLRNSMNEEILSSGFVNRWLIIPGEAPAPISRPPNLNETAVRALLDEVTNRFDDIATLSGGRPVEVPLSDECADWWDAYYIAQWHAARRDPEAGEITSRYPDLVRKVALAYALTDLTRAISPLRIELSHLKAAIELVKWQARGVQKLKCEWGGSDETRIEARILAALKNHRDDRDDDGNYRVMTSRRLKQLTYIKGVPSSIWNRALAALVKSGEVHDGYPSGTSYILGREYERRTREAAT